MCEHKRTHLWRQKKVWGVLYFSLFYFPEKRSLTKPRARHFSARLAASKPLHSSCLHLPQSCDYRFTCPCLAFYVVSCWGSRHRSSGLCSKCSHTLNHLPVPDNVFNQHTLMTHHGGFHYDIFIYMHNVFQSGSSQLSCLPPPPHQPPFFFPESWPSTSLVFLYVLLGWFTEAWVKAYLQSTGPFQWLYQ